MVPWVLRLVRLLKVSHYSTALEALIASIRSEKSAFGAALYLFFIALFASSSLMYVVEHRAQPENFSSIPTTMWWSLITLTTVGYGDVSPVTPERSRTQRRNANQRRTCVYIATFNGCIIN